MKLKRGKVRRNVALFLAFALIFTTFLGDVGVVHAEELLESAPTDTVLDTTPETELEVQEEPVAEEPQVDTVKEPVVEEPQAEPVTEPVAEELQAESVTGLVVEELQTEPVTESVAEELQAEPVTESVVEEPQQQETDISSEPEEEMPEVVSNFLKAVEKLASFGVMTEANAEEFNVLGQVAMNAYEAVQEAGLEDYEGVQDALMVLMRIADSVTGGTETTASYKGTVTLYGTPEAAIKSGPTYGSKVKIDLGTRTGQSWNNVSYIIPQVKEYFVLNDGWTIDYVSVAGNSSGNRQPGASFLLGMSGGSMVYYFKKTATEKTFTLKYNANGGSGTPATQTQKSTSSSHNFTVSNVKPTRSGYEFKGWSTSTTATNASYHGGDKINVTGTITLYAVWEKENKKYTLKYDANGGTGAPGEQTGTSTAEFYTFTVSNEKPTRDGYEFKGWSESSNATGASYQGGANITVSGTTTLYAVWEIISETVTATWKDGYTDNPIKTETVAKDISEENLKGLYPKEPERKGYEFSGWGKPERDGDGNITITAEWKEKEKPVETVTATWKDGYTDIPIKTETVAKGISDEDLKELYPKEPNREGYEFSGWGKPKRDGDGNITITAEWKEKEKPVETVTATWKDGYTDIPIKTETVVKGISDEDLKELYPREPERDGYEFDGWDVERDEDGNITITARWTESKENPTPEDPTPEDPTPEDPTPENPTPEDPTPEDPTPEDPTPVNPAPEDPTPENPTPGDPGTTTPGTTTPGTTTPGTTTPVELPVTPIVPTVTPAAPAPTAPATPVVTPVAAAPTPTPVTPAVTPAALTPVTPALTPNAEEATPGGQTETQAVPDDETPLANADLEDEEVPLAGNSDRWALINFALMNLSVFESLMLLIGYFIQTKKSSEEEEEDEKERKLKKKGIIRIVSLPIAIISLIAFFLTENIWLPTRLVDQYTLMMAVIAVIQTIMVVLSRKEEVTEEEEPEAEMA